MRVPEVFFGDEYKVLLRGGAWASAPVAVRMAFAIGITPIRRQDFRRSVVRPR